MPLLCDCMTPDRHGSHFTARNQEYVNGLALRGCTSRGRPHEPCVRQRTEGAGHDRAWGVFITRSRCSQQTQGPPPPGSMLVKHPLTGHFTSESRAACHQPQHDWPHYDGCTSFGIGDGPWITATAFLNDLSILQIRIAQFFFCLSWPCATRRKILR